MRIFFEYAKKIICLFCIKCILIDEYLSFVYASFCVFNIVSIYLIVYIK